MGYFQYLSTESNGDVKVMVQDRENPYVQVRLTLVINTVTLASPGTINTNTINLQAGHGVVTGNVINLQENQSVYQGIVTNVVVNAITLDTPLNATYSVSALAQRATDNLATANGSVTPVAYSIAPRNGAWHIVSMLISITDNTAMDDGTFGGIPALAKGVVFRRKDGVYVNLFNAKTNGDFQLYCDLVTYSTKAPAGSFGVNIIDNFNSGHGIVIRLDSATGDELQAIIQDDLTSLSTFRVSFSGHVVT